MSVGSSYRKSSSTPSSILKKTSSLRTRLSQIPATPTKVKFVLPHATKVRRILKDFVHKENVKDYENLLCLIRDADITDDDITSLLKEATQCVSLLNRDLRLFVEALLSVNCLNRNDSNVIKVYKSFIVSLITAHNYHAELVIDKLVSFFIQDVDSGGKIDMDKFCNVHSLLNTLMTKAPMCKAILLKSLMKRYPYKKKPSIVHEQYLTNMLWLTDYQPTLRFDVLHLIISNLLAMDISAPRPEIEKHYNGEDEEMFAMDDDRTICSTTILDNSSSVVETLDNCLDKLFEYMICECHNTDTNELNWDKAKGLYHDILRIFDTLILPTYNVHHVQYVMFLLSTFKPAMAEAFLNYLWAKVKNPNVAPTVRQTAVNYIVSFLARATFIPMTVLKGTLEEISRWIHAYISFQDGLECVNSDLRAHSVFYTTCQALFYAVAFRHKDLVTSKKNMIFLESLNMGKIVTSRLNPLRVCQPAVVQNFAAIARKYQLAYCYSVIEHNSRSTLPAIYRDEQGQVDISNSMLEAFYPFDPYLLKKSGERIYPHYRDYEEINFEINDVHMRDATEIDDFLESNDSPSTKLTKFSYGTSPGFKLKYH